MAEVDTFEAIDGFGDPILLAVGPRADKTGSSIKGQVKSGNPFRDPGSGTFGNGPAGAKVTKGGDVLKQLSPQAALYLTQIRNKVRADTIEVDVVDGRAHITLKRAGGAVAKLNLPLNQKAVTEPGTDKAADPGVKGKPTSRDKVVEEARSDAKLEKLSAEARAQRINDLVDYLHERYSVTGAIQKPTGAVRVDAPAGWDKKTIGGLSDAELKDVAARMAGRGWSPAALKKFLLPNITTARRTDVAPKTKEVK